MGRRQTWWLPWVTYKAGINVADQVPDSRYVLYSALVITNDVTNKHIGIQSKQEGYYILCNCPIHIFNGLRWSNTE